LTFVKEIAQCEKGSDKLVKREIDKTNVEAETRSSKTYKTIETVEGK
jgi:hypothetical protein